MQNGDWTETTATCPVHGNPARKEYRFGRYRNLACPTAWVTTYKGCNCATQTNGGSLRKLYFTSYQGAESEARYTIQRLEK